MTRYLALVDGEAGAYGVVIPELEGCTAMGDTMEAALANAVDAMRDWVQVVEEDGGTIPQPRRLEEVRQDAEVIEALAEGAMLTTVALVRHTGRPVKANLSLDSGVLEALDREAKRRHLTRSAMVEAMTHRLAAEQF